MVTAVCSANAVDQIEPLEKVRMLANRCDQILELDIPRFSRRTIFSCPGVLCPRIAAAFELVLQTRSILAELIKHD